MRVVANLPPPWWRRRRSEHRHLNRAPVPVSHSISSIRPTRLALSEVRLRVFHLETQQLAATPRTSSSTSSMLTCQRGLPKNSSTTIDSPWKVPGTREKRPLNLRLVISKIYVPLHHASRRIPEPTTHVLCPASRHVCWRVWRGRTTGQGKGQGRRWGREGKLTLILSL